MPWDNVQLALSQEVSGVTGDTTSPWARTLNTPGEMGGVFSRWGAQMAKSTDHPLLHNPDGTSRAFSDLSAGQQTAVILRTVSNIASGALGALGLVQNALDIGFANLTAPLAAMYPSMPAATMSIPYLGIPHCHPHPPSLVPPSPILVPLPSLGMVMIGTYLKVMIGGLPAARCGDIGIAPTCCGFTPFFNIYLGSSNVFIGGKRAARFGDMCFCCGKSDPMSAVNKAMAVAGIAIGGVAAAADVAEMAVADSAAEGAAKAISAAANAAQMAADAAALAIQMMMGTDPAVLPAPPYAPILKGTPGALILGNPTVLIGGFPMINIPDPVNLLLNRLAALRARRRNANSEEGQAGCINCNQ